MCEPWVVVYRHPNPVIRSFLTPNKISAYRVERFKGPLDEDSEKLLKGLGTIGEMVVREIMAIPGVEELYIKPTEVRMKKNPSVSWEEIERKTIEILNRALRRREIRLIKKDKSRT
ncbi:MAG: hypothetical protein V1689_15620 [Pseudomonadota bacterium]